MAPRLSVVLALAPLLVPALTGTPGTTTGVASSGPGDSATDGTAQDDGAGCGCRGGHAPSAISMLTLLLLTRRRRSAAEPATRKIAHR